MDPGSGSPVQARRPGPYEMIYTPSRTHPQTRELCTNGGSRGPLDCAPCLCTRVTTWEKQSALMNFLASARIRPLSGKVPSTTFSRRNPAKSDTISSHAASQRSSYMCRFQNPELSITAIVYAKDEQDRMRY